MQDFVVPFAVNPSGALVPPREAKVGISYLCPHCDCVLVLRAGSKKARHFGHPSGAVCSPESAIHRTAKRLIAQVIKANARGEGPRIRLHCECAKCAEVRPISLEPKHFSDAREEYEIQNFVCDVVAFHENSPRLAIEVFHTNPMTVDKKAELEIPWIELVATKVVENPYDWVPTSARLKDVTCKKCKTHAKNVERVARKFGIADSLYSAHRNDVRARYVASFSECYKCKSEIPLFWWRGVPFCEQEPPEPRPHTIQYRRSTRYGDSYWANTCPACHSMQGDNYIYLGSRAVFAGMPQRRANQQNRSGFDSVLRFMTRHI